MLKKTIEFKNLDGETISRDFYFNLTLPEITEMQHSMKEGLSEYWMDIVNRKDAGALLAAYKDFVSRAYGVRDADGITFLKSEEISRRFLQSDAYTQLFLECFGANASDDAFTTFMRGVIPDEVASQIPETLPSPEDFPKTTNKEKTLEDYSRAELLAMPQEQFDKLAGTDPQKMSREALSVAMQRRTQSS